MARRRSSFRSLALDFLEASPPAAAAAAVIFVGLTGLSLSKVPPPYAAVVSWPLVALVVGGSLALLWVLARACWDRPTSRVEDQG